MPRFDRLRASRKLAAQLLRFGGVGVAATAVHGLVYAVGLRIFEFHPQTANFFGFAIAVVISFLGHFHWTFAEGKGAGWLGPLFRFWAVALTGYGINAANVYLATEVFGAGGLWALASILMIAPAFTFLASKYWAFSAASGRRAA